MFPYQGQKVYARYNTDDVTKVQVYTESNEFICIASSRILSQLDETVSTEAIRENNRIKKARRKLTREQFPQVSVPTIEETVASMSSKGKVITLNDVKESVPVVNSTKHRHAKEIQSEEKRQLNKALCDPQITTIGAEDDIDEKLYQLYAQGG